jgi:FkbM family methyltransferase
MAKDAETRAEARFIKSQGMRFPKHRDIIQGRIRRLLRTNEYEAKETHCALRVVRAGDRVIELGAGIGYMSTLVATKREIESVHAFEANPHLIPYIQQVHAANGLENAKVVHGLLGPEAGEADFYVRPNILASSLTPPEGEEPGHPVKVPVHAAAEVFARIKPSVLICDIEGAEIDLLPQLDLSSLRAAVIETHPQWTDAAGINRLFRAFMDAGLAYYHRGSINKVVSFRKSW